VVVGEVSGIKHKPCVKVQRGDHYENNDSHQLLHHLPFIVRKVHPRHHRIDPLRTLQLIGRFPIVLIVRGAETLNLCFTTRPKHHTTAFATLLSSHPDRLSTPPATILNSIGVADIKVCVEHRVIHDVRYDTM